MASASENAGAPMEELQPSRRRRRHLRTWRGGARGRVPNPRTRAGALRPGVKEIEDGNMAEVIDCISRMLQISISHLRDRNWRPELDAMLLSYGSLSSWTCCIIICVRYVCLQPPSTLFLFLPPLLYVVGWLIN